MYRQEGKDIQTHMQRQENIQTDFKTEKHRGKHAEPDVELFNRTDRQMQELREIYFLKF